MRPVLGMAAILSGALVLAGCAVSPDPTPSSPTPFEPPTAFAPIPDRETVTVYDDTFDDNSGDWLEPGWDANTIDGGEYVITEGAGNSHRVMGNVPLALMPLYEVRAAMDIHGSGLDEVSIYCRLDHGFTGFYRAVAVRSGVRITKGIPSDDVPIDLFRADQPAIGPEMDVVVTLDCFAEQDGFHVELFLDDVLVAQAIDTDQPPEGGDVRIAWANLPPGDGEGPYVFAVRSLTLEARA